MTKPSSSYYTFLSLDDADKELKRQIKEGKAKLTRVGYIMVNEENYYHERVSIPYEKNHRTKAKIYFYNLHDILYIHIKVKRCKELDTYVKEDGRSIDSYDIRREYSENGFKKFIKKNKGKLCIIKTCSGYWNTNGSGYTSYSKAWEVTVEEGYNAIRHCGLEKEPELILI